MINTCGFSYDFRQMHELSLYSATTITGLQKLAAFVLKLFVLYIYSSKDLKTM